MKLEEIMTDLNEAMEKYPAEEYTALDPVFIHSTLKTFKDKVPTARKIVKKDILGSEVLTIDPEFYDSAEDYYEYLTDNKEPIRENLQRIIKFLTTLL